ncbi:GIY-YIG nuclease family protein [Pedobacter mucosus]|uniref:GIY-YIG nuclease family protein n=1 Tax=Pedobacter mucosus TaxID=2895286 RepID=UPI001EE46DCB|nr:GIY-YIG nuclease family protein [Pedobacter mucosus]UKT62579.1 GIY-YIG nuclease family protein [Pedobacter mucosus]
MPAIHNYFVYILECSDKSYYVGVTNDLDIRILQHNAGENKTAYTFKRRPVILMYYKRFDQIIHAIEFEKQVKGWSRKKKEALFDEDWDEIVRLSNYKNK